MPPVTPSEGEATGVPDAAAGYSGTPLYRKLGIAAGYRVLVRHTPDRFSPAILHPPGGATLHRRASPVGDYDVVLLFCTDAATLARDLPAAMTRTIIAGRCWVAWPKRTGRGPLAASTDLSENLVRDAALAVGWVDVKVCAIDEVWSGLCLVRRRENRPATTAARQRQR